MSRRAFTLVELLVGLCLLSIAVAIIYGTIHLLFSSSSRSNLTGLTRRSFLQKDSKAGLRRLQYRLREAIQVLTPLPGTTASELTFRDVTNTLVRVRLAATDKRVVSERDEGGGWVLESKPSVIQTSGGELPASYPVQINSCTAIRFTAIAADCISVQATLEWEGEIGSLLTVVKLRNSGQAY